MYTNFELEKKRRNGKFDYVLETDAKTEKTLQSIINKHGYAV